MYQIADEGEYESDTGLVYKNKVVYPYKPNAQGYIRVRYQGQNLLLHRVMWKIIYGYYPKFIDHINGNRQDNRLCNLRECTRQENNQNFSQKPRKHNKSSNYVGVSWDTETGRWKAKITVSGIQMNLGRYATQEEAFKAYSLNKLTLHKTNNQFKENYHNY